MKPIFKPCFLHDMEYRWHLLLWAFLFFISPLFGQTPIAYYPLDGNANDAVGSQNGTIVGTVTPALNRFSSISKAMEFSASGEIQISGGFSDQNFSISLWVKPGNSQNQFANIIDNNHTGFQNWVIQQDGNTLNRYVFGVHRSDGGVGVFFNLQAEMWQHVVLLKSANSVEVYVNGLLEQSTPWSGTVNYASPFLRFGNWSGGGRNWNGDLDEVKIFNTSLNSSQILDLFSEGNPNVGIPTANLQTWLKADAGVSKDGTNQLISWTDQSSNGKIAKPLSVSQQPLWVDNVLNNKPVLRFDGGDDILKVFQSDGTTPVAGLENGSTEFTFFVAMKATTPISAIRYQGGGGNCIVYPYNFTGPANGFIICPDGGPSGGIPHGLSSSEFNVGTARYKANVGTNLGMQTFVNGTLVAGRATQNVSSLGTDLLGIGGCLGGCGASEFFNGDIAEILIYNRYLSDVEKAQVEAYLSSKYDVPVSAQQKPGSGNAMVFGSSNAFIESPFLSGFSNTFSVEAWVKPSGTISLHSESSAGGGAQSGNRYVITPRRNGTSGLDSDAGMGFSVGTNGICVLEHAHEYFTSLLTYPVELSGWNHVLIVYNNKIPSLYLNGILVKTGIAGSKENVNVCLNANTAGHFGGIGGGSPNNDGSVLGLDELRIWNTALTQTQIRDRMCRKITSADALFGNLVAYYNFDEGTGNTVFDGTANVNNGTLLNGPTRVTSGAAIGNSSAHHYVTSGLPSTNLSVNGQDNLAIAYTAGTFSGEGGTQIYAVSEKPNTESGIEGPGSNNRYFGVFHASLSSPQYTATYNYTGNPFVTSSNEGQLGLFKRNDNTGTTWTNAGATLNTSSKTLTVSGQSTEYVLGSVPCTTPPTPTISAGGATTFCAGDSVTLTSSASSGNIWSNGATTQSIHIKTAGNFTVQVVIGGCSSVVSAPAGVVVSPISISGFSPAAAFTGDSVTVSVSCPLSTTQVLVNGGDVGAFRRFGNQIRFAIGSGNTTGKIRLVHTGGMVETVENLLVNPLPAIAGFSPVSGLPGTLVTLTGQHFFGISSVKLGNQSVVFTLVSSTQITFSVPSGALTGIISLTGTTGTGISASSFVVCPVLSPPIVSGNGGCGPASFPIQASGGGGDNFNWYTASSGGTPVFSGQTFAPFLAATSTFFVSSTSDNGFCENSVRNPISILVFPRPEVPLLTNDTLCSPGLATLSAHSSTPDIRYKWFNEGVLISGETSSSLSLFVNQTRQISVQAIADAQNGNCESAATNGLALLTTFSDILPDSATICPDSTRSIGLKAGGFPFESYLWFDGSTQSVTTINSPGTYSVRQFRFGCEKGDTVRVTTSNDAPIGGFTRITPSENQVDFDYESIVFSWTPAPQAKRYRLYLWPVNQAKPALATLETDGINATVNGLSPNTRFNWQVQAINDCHVLWGDTGEFFSKGLADLRVSNLQVSSTAIAGQRIAITYTVTNIGLASTDFHSWKDHFYISNEKQINIANLSFAEQENAILYGLGEKPNPGFLLPGQSYTRTVEFSLKSNVIGPRFVVVLVNTIGFACDSLVGDSCAKNFSPFGGTLKEARFTNNSASSSLQIQDVLRPDLTITNIGIAQSVFGGTVPNLSYSVKNIGFAVAKGVPIQSFPSESPHFVSIPIVRGSGFVYQPEGIVECEESVWKDRIFVSKDSVFDEKNATLLKEVLVRPRFFRAGNVRCFDLEQGTLSGITNTIPPNPAWFGVSDEIAIDSTLNVNVVLPIPHNLFGPTFLHVVTNASGSVKESNSQVNNIKTVKVNVNLAPPADLSVQNLVVPNTGASGRPIQIQYRIRNVGANSPKPSETVWNDSIFISRSSLFNRDSCRVLGVFNTAQGDTLLPGRFYTRKGELKVPDGISGNWFVHVIGDANNRVFEFTFNANNLASSPAILINPTPSPDIEPLDFQFPADWFSLENIQVKLKLRNNGPGTAFGPWENTVFIAENISGKNTMASVSLVFPEGDSIQAGAQKELVFNFSGLNVTGNLAANLFVIANATGSLFENGQTANNRKTMGSFTLKTEPDSCFAFRLNGSFPGGFFRSGKCILRRCPIHFVPDKKPG